MISSFFSKTKPINYLFLFGVFFLFYLIRFLVFTKNNFSSTAILISISTLVLIFLQGALFNQMVFKTRITQPTTFGLLVFTVVFIGFLDVVIDLATVAANFFIIWGIYFLIAADSTKKLSLEVYNATLCFCIATVFTPLAVFLLILIPIGIFMFTNKSLRNWLMPLMAVATFFLITFALTRIFGNSELWLNSYWFQLNTSIYATVDIGNYTRLFLYVLVIASMFLLILFKSSLEGGVRLIKLRFLIITFIVILLVSFLGLANNQGLELLLFSFCPAAMITTNYFEIFDFKRFKEPLLAIGILIPLTFAIFRLITY